MTEPQLLANSLNTIWPLIDMNDIHQYLKVLGVYDPLNSDTSVRDYCAWFATVMASLLQHSNYVATYLLTRIVPPTFTEQILKSIQNIPIPSLPMLTLARLYGQDVYCQRKINSIEVADGLKVGKDMVLTLGDLYQWVVDLHFSRNDQVHPLVWCYELVVAIGNHLTDNQRVLFNNSMLLS